MHRLKRHIDRLKSAAVTLTALAKLHRVSHGGATRIVLNVPVISLLLFAFMTLSLS